MRSTRFLAIPAVAAALSGCSMQARDTRAAYEPVTDVSSGSATPMATLSPSAGEVISVLQSREQGVLTQRIVLRGDPQTDGENHIVVKVDQSNRVSSGLDGPAGKPSESMIQSELDSQFGGVDMRLSQTFNRNSFGPFGYAIGHPSAGMTCIYAWQWQGARVLPLIGGAGELASSTSLPAAQTSVRVRLCKARIGEQEMVAMLKDMQVFPPGSSDPYQDSASATAGQGGRDALAAAGVAGGASLAPKDAAGDGDGTPRRRKHGHERHAHRRGHRAETANKETAPTAAGGPIVNVPLPGGGTTASAAPAASTTQNPLLAPLQTAAPARAPAASNDMPLPPRVSAAIHPTAPADAAPTYAPIPMPN